MAYSKKPTYSFPDINSTGINKIPQGRIITVDDYSSGKPKMFLTEDLSSLNDSSTIQDAIVQGKLIENQVISSEVAPIGVYKTVNNKTIGTNGDFKTIQEAFTYVQTHQKQTLNQNLTLTLLEDLNNETLYFKGAWYPYLRINCNGFVLADKLTIDMSCFLIDNLKLNGRLVSGSSNLWLTGNIDINYQNTDYPSGCITGLAGSIIYVSAKNLNFSTTTNRSALHSRGNSMIYISGSSTITQTTGENCFSVSNGGIIQLNGGLTLTGVTVPKANQAANQITNHGLIIGNYYSI